jgi:hypothetical protein
MLELFILNQRAFFVLGEKTLENCFIIAIPEKCIEK